MLIDIHSHYMPRSLLRALERRRAVPHITTNHDGKRYLEYGPGAGVQLIPIFHEPDLILEQMDASRIDHAILSVTIPGVDWLDPDEAETVADESNRETAELVERYPGRFSGFATVPLQSADRAIEVLERALDMGLKGVMIYSNAAGSHLDDPSRRAFFDAVARLEVPALLHPTYPLCAPTLLAHGLVEIAGFLFDTTTAALRLVFDGIFVRHPDFKLIVAHAGSLIPYFVGRIDHIGRVKPGATGKVVSPASDQIRKLYVDTVTAWAPSIELSLGFFGPGKVMLGSDHPFWPMTLPGRILDEIPLSVEDRARIECENAIQLFRLSTQLQATEK